MNRVKLHVHKGDQVEVISGNFRGSTGTVLAVLQKKQRVLIEGVRMIKKHMRKSQENPQGQIAEREGPIHISNVKVVERRENAADKKEGKKGAKGKAAAPKTAAKKTSAKRKSAKEEA